MEFLSELAKIPSKYAVSHSMHRKADIDGCSFMYPERTVLQLGRMWAVVICDTLHDQPNACGLGYNVTLRVC